jgi:hypothetical protein
MQPRTASLIRFFLAAFAVVILGLFALGVSLPVQAAIPEASGIFAGSDNQVEGLSFPGSDSMLTEQAELGVPDDGIAFEDSIEMFRFDRQQRAFGIDREMSGPKVVSKTARNARPNISPPLLV